MSFALGCLIAVGAAGAAPDDSSAPGVLVFASGPISITDRSGQSALVTKGGQLRIGDMIRTGASTHAQLRFRDGTFLSLFPATDLRLDAYRFGDVPKESELALFTLFRGGARFQTGSIGKVTGSAFRVNTGAAALEGSGGEFVAMTGDGLQVRVGAGRVTLRNKAGALTAAAGQRAHVTNRNTPPYLIGTLIPERIAP